MKKAMLVLAGPTAVGKSEVAVCLAKKIDAEVISADAMQVYRGMDIGSAKISVEEMQGVTHHMIDVAWPEEGFDVLRYATMVRQLLPSIYERGRIPLLCGGAGFYIQAVTNDIDFSSDVPDMAYRRKLQNIADTEGVQALHQALQQVDPLAAKAIHPNNVKRVIRALEFYHSTGQTISSHNKAERKKNSPYDLRYFVLTMDRAALYRRIDERVEAMFARGLVEEVKSLSRNGCSGDMIAMQGLGYKEVFDYLEGKTDLARCKEIIQRDSRHYAKRQLTWFRAVSGAVFIERQPTDTAAEIAERIMEILKDEQWLDMAR